MDRVKRALTRGLSGVAALVCVALLLVALLGPFFAPHTVRLADILETDAPAKQAPGRTHLFGTDWHGLDVFSKCLHGAGISVGLGLAASLVSLLIGGAVGLTSGYFGGWYDNMWMRIIDVVMAFPSLLLAILIAATMRPGLFTVFLALTMVSWAGIARLVRSLVLTLRRQEFVTAAVALGADTGRILAVHLVPNLIPSLMVVFSTRIGITILSEASLNFLGLGAPPDSPSWGVMVFYGMDHLGTAPWCALAPATAIGLTVLAFNLVGDGLRDALDPRVRDA